MTKDQVFVAITGRGADRVVAPFSGGHDEGGPDGIRLMKGGDVIGEINLWDEGEWVKGEGYRIKPDTPENRQLKIDGELAEAICQPIHDRWGGFAGDFYVNGTVAWDVATREVTMDYDEEVPQSEHYSEVL
jgi:hypothetical protein